MFGGVVFIAVLIALFARQTTSELQLQASQPSTRDSLDAQARAVESLERAVIAAAAGTSQRESEASRITSVMRQLDADLAEANRRLQVAMDMGIQLDDKNRSLEEQSELRDQRLAMLQQEIDRLNLAIAVEESKRTAQARLPVTRETDKAPFHLILQRGRVFEMYTYDFKRRTTGVVASDVIATELADDITQFETKPAGGFAWDGVREGPARWQSIVERARNDRQFVYLLVYPDSYEVFRDVKEATLAAGLEYHVEILGTSTVIKMVPADRFNVQ
jgi:hypothetical protein